MDLICNARSLFSLSTELCKKNLKRKFKVVEKTFFSINASLYLKLLKGKEKKLEILCC